MRTCKSNKKTTGIVIIAVIIVFAALLLLKQCEKTPESVENKVNGTEALKSAENTSYITEDTGNKTLTATENTDSSVKTVENDASNNAANEANTANEAEESGSAGYLICILYCLSQRFTVWESWPCSENAERTPDDVMYFVTATNIQHIDIGFRIMYNKQKRTK